MSNTRHASGGPMRQERFASSQEFERGLMANLVAKRCALVKRSQDRELIWFLQLVSHQSGGLKELAQEICERFAERIATPAMLKFGTKSTQRYNKAQAAQLCREIPSEIVTDGMSYQEMMQCDNAEIVARSWNGALVKQVCDKAAAEQLEDRLTALCLDPAAPIEDGMPWYFPTLISTLREVQAEWIAASAPAAVTAIGQDVCDMLEYALAARRLVIIDGHARIGKTFSAKAWCDQHPGQARYVQVTSTGDEIGFYRAIAKSLGVSINLNSKAQELRGRIEETLQTGQLMLVMDEAHYLWPNVGDFRRAIPVRINWLMTALVNYGVPVALVTTPQFMLTQQAIESGSRWTSEQFTGRIGRYKKLADTLSEDDLRSVASAVLPEGDKRSIEALANYAQTSARYLAGIEAVVAMAQFMARKEGREQPESCDIKRAIKDSIIPSDRAFATAMQAADKHRSKTKRRAIPGQIVAAPMPAQRMTAAVAPAGRMPGEIEEQEGETELETATGRNRISSGQLAH